MKKKVLFLMFVLSMIMTSCHSKKSNSPNTADEPNAPMEEAPPHNAVIEYGSPNLITNNTEPLLVYIRYPVAGTPMDDIVREWADDLYQNANTSIMELRKSDPKAQGEINIQFNSYLVNDRYAGIIEDGMFMTSQMANPQNIVRMFNIDTKNSIMLENSDILDESRTESILQLLREKILEEYPHIESFVTEMDKQWIEHIAIGHDGIIVLLEKGAVLPAYLGSVQVTLPYDELGSDVILGSKPSDKPPTKPSEAPSETGEVVNDRKIDPSKPMIALTFDDGPSQYTSRVLELLKENKASATFCVVGNLVNSRKDIVKRASELGCDIIGHSWDHRDLSKLSSGEIKEQLNHTKNVIQSVTGVPPKMMYRPPYGAVNDTLKSVSAELGFSIINWSVDPEDWRTKNTESVYNAIMNVAGDRDIILCHDLYETTVDAMERVIPQLISKGYQLVTVSELMHYSHVKVESGQVYRNAK